MIGQEFANIISDQFDSIIQSILSYEKGLKNVEHSLTKGVCKESIIIDKLKNILPSWIGIGTGIIVDSNGAQSPQIDIVIYDKNALPVLFTSIVGFFPIESVLYVIEVKSILNATEIKDTIEKYKKLKTLKNKKETIIRTVLLGYKSDLNNENELERYAKYDTNYIHDPLIRIIASIEKGEYFYLTRPNLNNNYSNWSVQSWLGITNKDQIIPLKVLFSSIINTLFNFKIGDYLFRNDIHGFFLTFSDVLTNEENQILYEKSYYKGLGQYSYKKDEETGAVFIVMNN